MATPLTADQLVSALSAEGCRVSGYRSWRTHNRNHMGAWGPVNGVIIHHTVTSGTENTLGIVYDGYAGLPGPLCQSMLAKDGTVHMIGNGRCNHAGSGDSRVLQAVIAENSSRPAPRSNDTDGNTRFYGLEIENLGNGNDPYPGMQYEVAVRWATAICRAHGWSANSVIGHKEWTNQKIDPSFDMNRFRADVANRLGGNPSGGGGGGGGETGYEPFPGTDFFQAGTHSEIITRMGQRLVAEGCSAYAQGPGPNCTDADRESFRLFQRKLGDDPQFCDGIPGPKQWDRLRVPKS